MSDTEYVLEIDAIAPRRQVIKINYLDENTGEPKAVLWQMRNKSELSLVQIKQVETVGQQCMEMAAQEGGVENLTVEQSALLDQWVWELLEVVFYNGLDATVVNALSYQNKLKIFEAFGRVILENDEDAPKVTEKPKTPRRAAKPKQ